MKECVRSLIAFCAGAVYTVNRTTILSIYKRVTHVKSGKQAQKVQILTKPSARITEFYFALRPGLFYHLFPWRILPPMSCQRGVSFSRDSAVTRFTKQHAIAANKTELLYLKAKNRYIYHNKNLYAKLFGAELSGTYTPQFHHYKSIYIEKLPS